MTGSLVVAKGLEGVVVDTSSICSIDGNAGRLSYRGYDIHDLVENTTFEQVAHLLWKGELPTRSQLTELNAELTRARSIPESAVTLIRSLPSSSGALDVLRTVISALGTGPPLEKTDVPQAIVLTAKIPTIATAFDRIRKGQKPLEPRSDLNHAANYLYMLTGQEPDDTKVNALNKYLICLADHGMNASTFTARVVASTLSDMYSAVTAAIGALKGPLHGGAPAPVLRMLQEIEKPERAEAWMINELSGGKRLMGFGHRVYRTTDPRAEILRKLASKISERSFFQLAEHVEQTGLEILRKRSPAHAHINVEFYSAVAMHSIGFSPDMFTPSFACSRIVGWTAHIIEQTANNRLIRPEIEYTGPVNRKVTPIESR